MFSLQSFRLPWFYARNGFDRLFIFQPKLPGATWTLNNDFVIAEFIFFALVFNVNLNSKYELIPIDTLCNCTKLLRLWKPRMLSSHPFDVVYIECIPWGIKILFEFHFRYSDRLIRLLDTICSISHDNILIKWIKMCLLAFRNTLSIVQEYGNNL